MSRTRARFRQGDISRAVKGATVAGLSVAKVEIDQDGKIVIVSAENATRQEPVTLLDAWKAKLAARDLGIAHRHRTGGEQPPERSLKRFDR